MSFLPRRIKDLEQPGKAPSCPHHALRSCLVGGGWARCPGAARSVPALGRSKQLTRALCCSHPWTALECLKGEFAVLSHSGVRNGCVTFFSSAFHFLIVSTHADNTTCSQSASFPRMTKALSSSENTGGRTSLHFPSVADLCSWELCWPLIISKSSCIQNQTLLR